MSNKSRLQTNNTNLQALITKANNLPDAGGGSGGGVELCQCSIVCDAPMSGTYTITYTQKGMQLATKEFEIMSGTQVEVVKGTIVTLTPWTSQSGCSGDCTEILSIGYGGAYFINGDSIIQYG